MVWARFQTEDGFCVGSPPQMKADLQIKHATVSPSGEDVPYSLVQVSHLTRSIWYKTIRATLPRLNPLRAAGVRRFRPYIILPAFVHKHVKSI